MEGHLLMSLAPINKLQQRTCTLHPNGAAKPLPLGLTLLVLSRFCLFFSRTGEVSQLGLRPPWGKHQAFALPLARELPVVTHERQINTGTNLAFGRQGNSLQAPERFHSPSH